MNGLDCAPGQDCIDGRCSGAPDCPDPNMAGVRVFGRTIEECERLVAAAAIVCEAEEELYNNACGCGCIGDGGAPMMCDCPDVNEPVCGLNGIEYQNMCEANCVGVDANPGLCNACEPQECMNECPANTVLARNDRGCEVCDCCEVPVCNNVCNLGTRRNELGCPSCECCPSLDACNLDCPAGYVTDATGCAICECSDEEVIIREREN